MARAPSGAPLNPLASPALAWLPSRRPMGRAVPRIRPGKGGQQILTFRPGQPTQRNQFPSLSLELLMFELGLFLIKSGFSLLPGRLRLHSYSSGHKVKEVVAEPPGGSARCSWAAYARTLL